MKLIKLDQYEFESPDSEERLILAIEHVKLSVDWMIFYQNTGRHFNHDNNSSFTETIVAKLPRRDIVIKQIKLQTGFLLMGQETAVLLDSGDLYVECLILYKHLRIRFLWESTA